EPIPAAHGDLLADLRREVVRDGANGLARERLLREIRAERGLLRDREDVADEALERVVARREVGLDVDLDDRRAALVGRDARADLTLGGDGAGALGDLGLPLLEDDLDRLLHVALGLDQGALAVAHPRLGSLTKLLDRLRIDAGHGAFSLHVGNTDSPR